MGLDLGLDLLLLSSFCEYEVLMFSCRVLISRTAMNCGTSLVEIGQGSCVPVLAGRVQVPNLNLTAGL